MKKKIVIILPLLLGSLMYTAAQDNQSKDGVKSRTMSFSEANRLNGSIEPTVNGKPYSQHKAEQEALKQQKQKQQAAAYPAIEVALGNGDNNPAASAVVRQPDYKSPQLPAVTEDQQKAQIVTGPYKTPVAAENKNAPDDKDIKPVPATSVTSSSVTSTETKKVNPAPEVPAQFRLRENATWSGRSNDAAVNKPAAQLSQPVQIKDNPAQSVFTEVKTEIYKTPEIKETYKPSGDEEKRIKSAEQPAATSKSDVSVNKNKS